MDSDDTSAITAELNTPTLHDNAYGTGNGGPLNPYQAGHPFLDVNGDDDLTPDDRDAINDFIADGSIPDFLLSDRPATRYYDDDTSNLQFVVDPMQSVTEYQYDARNRRIAELRESPEGRRG